MNAVIVALVIVAAYLVASLLYPMLLGGAGYTPAPRAAIAESLRLAELKKDEVFYDLGCGTGEALIEAAKLSDHVKGVEIEPVRWFIAKLRARRAQVVLGNLFKQDIADADVIFLFQYQGKINNRIATRIKAETRSGTRVISYHHPIENMQLVSNQKEIFIYRT